MVPSVIPSDSPSMVPSVSPSDYPSAKPSPSPTATPTTLTALFESIVDTNYGSISDSPFQSARLWFVDYRNHPSSALGNFDEGYMLVSILLFIFYKKKEIVSISHL